jgi:hypothetical protein
MKTNVAALKRLGAFFLICLAIFFIPVLHAQVPQSEQGEIDRIIGTKGTYVAEEGVYKITIPRAASTVVLDYQTLSPTMGLNSWAAFCSAKYHGALLTGEFLLLEDEVDAVIASALKANLEVTGLADSTFFDGPRTKTLDISGVGTYEQLAGAFRAVLDEIQRATVARTLREEPRHPPTISLDSSIVPGPIDDILSMHGVLSNGAYRAAIGRRGTIYGESAGREMGSATWISISGGLDADPYLAALAALPLEERYVWRVMSALRWAFCDLETESVNADIHTLSKEDLKKVVEPLTLRATQFCLFANALLGEDAMERIMRQAVRCAKQSYTPASEE